MTGKNIRKKKWQQALLIILATSLLLLFIFPYFYMLMQAFAPWPEVERRIIPTQLTLKSFEWIFTGGGTGIYRPWMRATFNSFFVSFVAASLMVVSALLVAYAIAKLKFKGSKFINNFILFHMFFPGIILLVPIFMVARFFNIDNTYFGMIIPTSVSVWAIFMYVSFFKGIPNEMIEAARIDGATEYQIAFKIVFPLAKPITTILFLFLFTARWGELLWDMIIVAEERLFTLNVLVSSLFGPYSGRAGPLYAAAVLLTFPIIILFLFYSKNFKEGMKFVLK